MSHSVKISDELWNDIAELIGVDPSKRSLLVGDYINNTMTRDASVKLAQRKNGWVKPQTELKVEPKIEQPAPVATTKYFDDDGIPHFPDTSGKYDHWPLRPEVAAFVRYMGYRGVTAMMLKPDHSRDHDDEHKAKEEKNFWVRCGYQFEGMDDSRTAAEHWADDIVNDRPASDLPDKAKSAHAVMRGKFKAWWKQRTKMK